MNERSQDPRPENPEKTAASASPGPPTVEPVNPARSPGPDPYAAVGLEISDVLRRAHEAAERVISAAELEASAIRVATEADRAVAEQTRAQAITELLRAKELRGSLDEERRRLRAQSEAMAATQSRNADRDRSIEVLLLASLEVLRTGDTGQAPHVGDNEVIDLRDATPLEPRAHEGAQFNRGPSGSAPASHDSETRQSESSASLETTSGVDDELTRAVRAAVARVVGSWDVAAEPSRSN